MNVHTFCSLYLPIELSQTFGQGHCITMTMEMCFTAEPCSIWSYIFVQNLLFPLDFMIFSFDCCVFYIRITDSTPEDTWELPWYKPTKREEACNVGMGQPSLNGAPAFAGERLVHGGVVGSDNH